MNQQITCVNGEFVAAERASVPVTNRGFRFGDGLFETIRIEGGVPYQWDLHFARLHDGLAAIRIAAPNVDWKKCARELIRQNAASEGWLRLSVTRGNRSAGYLPEADAPFWVLEYLPPRPLPEKSFRLWRSAYTRAPLSALPVNHKLAQGLGSTLALLEAQENGCDEALQLTPNGLLSSAASANLFWIKSKTIFTPSLKTGCLNGTTRAAIFRLSPVPIHEIYAEPHALEDAEALFLSNSRLGVWPVTSLEPRALKFNAEHPLITQLQQLISNERIENKTKNSANWRIS